MEHNVFTVMNNLDAAVSICEAIGDLPENTQETPPKLDPSRFQAYVKSPSDIDEKTLKDIAAVIDGKRNIEPPADGCVPVATPSTLDRLLNSVAIVYITDKEWPIAAANIVDPTKEDFRGIAPLRYYSLLSGYNLDGRVQQEFFAVSDQYKGQGVNEELRAQLNALDMPTFIVADSTDKECIENLAKSGYQFIAQLDDKTSKIPVQLWVDNAGETPETTNEDGEANFMSQDVDLNSSMV